MNNDLFTSFFNNISLSVNIVNNGYQMTDNIKNQNNGLEQSSTEKKVLEGSIESNYDLNLAEGIEAYYSERYGWTLRRKSI